MDIATKSSAYKAMEEYFRLADDLLGGTIAMRTAASRWLPAFEGEEQKEYAWRLSNAVLRNLLGKAADLLIGHMFREGLDKTDLNLDEAIVKDFDLLGSSIDQYAAKIARHLLTHGLAHTYTEFPRVSGERSIEDEQKGIRPYALFIRPTDAIFALPKYVNGAALPADFRWLVTGELADGLGDRQYAEVRRLRIAGENDKAKVGEETVAFTKGAIIWEVWRGDTIATNFALIETGQLKGVDYIPVRTAYADYQGFMRSVPILDPVAQKNREHWRTSSDHNCIVQMSRFPMFSAVGVSAEEAGKINILGPWTKLVSTNPDARFSYTEPSGAAVEQSFKDLERIVRDAEQESVEALYKAGSDTATGRRIDLLESLSPAQRTALETKRHINQVLEDFGKRLNREVGEIEIDLDFGFSENEQMIVDALFKARALGDISRERAAERLQQLGVYPDEWRPKEIAAEADNEEAERGRASEFAPADAEPGDGERPSDKSDIPLKA